MRRGGFPPLLPPREGRGEGGRANPTEFPSPNVRNRVTANAYSYQRPTRCWKGFNLNLNRFKTGCGVAAIVSLLSLASQAQEVIVYSHGFEADDSGFLLLEESNSAAWGWGISSTTSVGPGAVHAGSKCWGTVLDRRGQN